MAPPAAAPFLAGAMVGAALTVACAAGIAALLAGTLWRRRRAAARELPTVVPVNKEAWRGGLEQLPVTPAKQGAWHGGLEQPTQPKEEEEARSPPLAVRPCRERRMLEDVDDIDDICSVSEASDASHSIRRLHSSSSYMSDVSDSGGRLLQKIGSFSEWGESPGRA
uniref:Uncharacterized protein n=1 Tax=Alexandrium catenella TaxID=2925 RepID=A0A7S1QZC1_ALECA|mmetsp:Transcript_41591/g.112303  ORF Transcript_41591/g.112303 Transcript_41591/m.112303 type:complete len:166 (+) Transcript_41591:71-568(+)